MTKVTDGSESELWLARLLFLLLLRVRGDVEEKDVAFVQYMEVTPPLYEWTGLHVASV